MKNTIKQILAILTISCFSGSVGIFLHWLFEVLGEVAYGSQEIVGLSHASGLQLFSVLTLTGIFLGIIWYVLQKDTPLVSVKQMLNHTSDYQKYPPVFKQATHAIIQVMSVALGSPIGKEVAPRELGSLWASYCHKYFGLSDKDYKLLVALGSASALSAIYHVPLASTIFAFECLGLLLSLKHFILAFLSTMIASQLVYLVYPSSNRYDLGQLHFQFGDIWAYLLVALIAGGAGFLFKKGIGLSEANKFKDKRLLFCLPILFALLGGFALYFPGLLGNGEALAKIAIASHDTAYLIALLLFKLGFVLLSLKFGAYGGTLTPSFAVGVAIGAIVSLFLAPFVTGIAPLAMLIGASVVLSITMQAPLTGIALTYGFTGQNTLFLLFILLFVILIKYLMRKTL